jgi:hypothetical protein
VRPADAAASAGRRGLPPLLRLEARRPAAWIALFVAGGGSLGLRGAAAGPLATAVGGLLAVAAIGHLCGAGGLVTRRAWPVMPLLRVSWPVAGALLAAGWLALGGWMGAAVAAVCLAASGLATAAVFAAFLRLGATEAVAASQTLAITGLGAAAGLAVVVAGGSPVAQGAAIVAAWGLVAGSLLAGQGHDRPAAVAAGRHRSPLPGFGPAMASALAGMAGCYFLAPQFDWAYAVIAAGWFLVLAVPAATPRVGPAAAARLLRSAAGRPAVPVSRSWAMAFVATTAGLLAWPAMVAAVLAGPEAWRAGGPLAALAILSVAAALTMVAAAVAGSRSHGEVARAVVLSAAAVGAIAAAASAAEMPAAPGLPGLPPVLGAWARQTGVEARRSSCQTSQLTQMPRSARLDRQTVSSRRAPGPDTRAFRSCRS